MDGRGLLAAVTLSAAVAWSAPTAVTNRLTQVLSGTDGDQQTLAATNWTDGCVVHAGADYLVDLTSPFRLPASTPLVFGGNSLQLGTDQKQAFVVSKGADVTFAYDGLFLKNVRWDHWQGGYRPSFHGRVTVLSRQSNPVRFVTGTAQAAHTFTGPWFATAEKGVWVSASEARAKGHTLQLTGDLSGFAGRFRVPAGGFPNGLSSYESYALGLEALDAESKPLLGIRCSDAGGFIVTLNVRPPTEMEGRIRYRLESSATPDFASSELGPLSSSPVFTVSPTVSQQFFRVQIVF